MKNFHLYTLFILMFGVSSYICAAEKQQKAEYKFGVFPYLSPVRMDEIYSPVSDEIANRINHKVKFRTSSTFKKFFAKLKAEYYDIALIQPFWYPVAVDKKGYIPLLRMEEPFVSLIMVLNSSQINTVDDLRGKIIATPPAFVPVVHMARRALIKKGITPGKDVIFKAYKSVDSCFQHVLTGKASACVTPPFAPAVFEKAMNIKLRTVLKSSSIPNLSIVVHPRVSAVAREQIRKTIMSWKNTKKGKHLLSNMQTKRFVPITDKEYDIVRQFLKELKK